MRPGAVDRKQFLVNQSYQVRFMAEIILVVILATVLSALGTYILMTGELQSGFQSSESKLASVHEALPKILMVSTFVTIFAMVLVGIFITLRETHRVIGPVGKMENKFREMSEGNYGYMIPFRKGDLMKGLDDSINIHLNNLSDFFTNYNKAVQEIGPLLTAIEQGDGDAGENLQKIRNLLAELEQQADAFRAG
jgi:hypothetical protein